MKIYLVINEDRHIDTDVSVFADKGAAVKHAREIAMAACEHYGGPNEKVDEEYHQNGKDNPDWFQRSGWIYWGRYSVESDRVLVEEKVLHET